MSDAAEPDPERGDARAVTGLRNDEFSADKSDPYAGDLLKRRESVEELCALVESDPGPFVAAIYGRFGSGKTAWLRMFAARQRSQRLHVVEFDAWRHGYTRDPQRDLLSCLAHKLGSTSAADRIRSALTKMAGRLIESATAGYVTPGDWSSDPPTAARDWDAMRELHEEVQDALADAVNANGGKLVVVVDELDRCLPSYALGVLDAVRHLLDVPGVIVVVGLTPDEIQARVKHLYGHETAAAVYLRRLVDYPIELPQTRAANGGMSRFLSKVYGDEGASDRLAPGTNDYRDAMIATIVDRFGLSLRDIQQFVPRVVDALDKVTPLTTPRSHLNEGETANELFVLALWALRLGDPAAYEALMLEEQADGFAAAAAMATALDATPGDSTACRMVAYVAYVGIGARSGIDSEAFAQQLSSQELTHPLSEPLVQAVAEQWTQVVSSSWDSVTWPRRQKIAATHGFGRLAIAARARSPSPRTAQRSASAAGGLAGERQRRAVGFFLADHPGT